MLSADLKKPADQFPNTSQFVFAVKLADVLALPLSPSQSDLDTAFTRADYLFTLLPDLQAVMTRENIPIPRKGAIAEIDPHAPPIPTTDEIRNWADQTIQTYLTNLVSLLRSP